MATKNGLVESLVMRTTPMGELPPLAAASEDEPRLQAAMARLVDTAAVTASPVRMRERLRPPDVVGRRFMVTLSPRHAAPV